MENYQFDIQDTLDQSKESTPQYKIEILEQLQLIQTETLSFINIEESDEDIDASKQKKLQTQLFCRRASIQESQESSQQSNDNYNNQVQIKQINQQIQYNKQLDYQQLKRTMKRSQTAFKKDFGHFAKQHRSKIFLKRANQTIVNNFEQIRKQKSIITYNINQIGKQHLRTIQVKYFRTNLSKVLFIEKNMTAIEFIVLQIYLLLKNILSFLSILALKEYTLERRFDQNLYEYKNYTLAYQLETLEDQMEMDEDKFRKPIQRTKSFNEKDDDNIAARRVSCDERAITSQVEYSFAEIDDRTITIDYPAILSCKQVDIVVNSTCQTQFGIDLLTLKKTYELFPQYTILMVEDTQTQSNQQIRLLNTSTLENVFDSLNNGPTNKRSKNDYYLRLKYPCIHTDIGPLCLNTPIKDLPIHWLVLEKKYSIESQTPNLIDISNKFSNFKQINYVEDGFQSYIIIFKIIYRINLLLILFQFLKEIFEFIIYFLLHLNKQNKYIKNIFQINVIHKNVYIKWNLRIIYLRYILTRSMHQCNQKGISNIKQQQELIILTFESSISINRITYPKIILCSNMFKNYKESEKIIKLKAIKECSLDKKQNKLYFTYKNSVRNFKQLCFIPQQSNDKRTQAKLNKQFFEIYQKLDKLLGIRKNHLGIYETQK